MSNSIQRFKNYAPLLDEVYMTAAKTAVLESDATLAKTGANANEIIIPKLTMDGLGNYSRNDGYVKGDVTLTNETVQFNYERGRMFSVDNMDDEETAGIAFGKLAGEFIRVKVVPEIDAVRFAAYASAEGITKAAPTAYSAGDAVLADLVDAMTQMDNDEVPSEERHLFIAPMLYNLAISVDANKSRAILDEFASINKVPQTRFYTAVTLKDGTTAGEEAGGYSKADGAADINFLIVHKPALLQFTKHAAPKVITPDLNQDADAWKFGYRIYGLNDVFENKTAGIYLNAKPVA